MIKKSLCLLAAIASFEKIVATDDAQGYVVFPASSGVLVMPNEMNGPVMLKRSSDGEMQVVVNSNVNEQSLIVGNGQGLSGSMGTAGVIHSATGPWVPIVTPTVKEVEAGVIAPVNPEVPIVTPVPVGTKTDPKTDSKTEEKDGKTNSAKGKENNGKKGKKSGTGAIACVTGTVLAGLFALFM